MTGQNFLNAHDDGLAAVAGLFLARQSVPQGTLAFVINVACWPSKFFLARGRLLCGGQGPASDSATASGNWNAVLTRRCVCWLLRIGLYVPRRPLEAAADWVWI